jgi:hypothetical protein
MNDMESLPRGTLASINSNLTVATFQTFQHRIVDRLTEERLITRLTTLFGALALLPATIGLCGVVRRTSEIGIHMALGVERGRVMAMVLRGAIFQAGIGLAIGAPVAFLRVRFVKPQLYQISYASAAVMVFAIATLAVAACIAGVMPARRAASIDLCKR